MPTYLQDFTDSLGVYKFDQKGNELFSYNSPTLYYNYRTGMYVWDDADVILLTAYEGYVVLDLNDGSLIAEKSMSEYAWFERDSVAGKYLTVGYFTNSSDNCNLTVDVFTAESVKTGEVYKSFSFSVPLVAIDAMIPIDDENVIISNKSEIYLYNMSSKESTIVGEFSNMEMKYPILMTCSEPYHFVAGYQDYAISGFAYDPTTGLITPANDFTYGSNSGYIADYVVWADKDASVLSFLFKSKGNYGNWVLSDGPNWYRYNVTDMDGVVSWVSSEKGTVAAIHQNSNFCYLYDVSVESDHYNANDSDIQEIRQPMYLTAKTILLSIRALRKGKAITSPSVRFRKELMLRINGPIFQEQKLMGRMTCLMFRLPTIRFCMVKTGQFCWFRKVITNGL